MQINWFSRVTNVPRDTRSQTLDAQVCVPVDVGVGESGGGWVRGYMSIAVHVMVMKRLLSA